jgi:D-sedoheptulose 7-phosphate isomerase
MLVINYHLTTLAVALQDLDADAPRLQSWGTNAASVLLSGGRLLTCGAGGSAEQARHLAANLARRDDDRPPLAAMALAAEFPGAADALAVQVRALGRPGDLLFCLSDGSSSDEVVAAVAAASEIGMAAWALTGPVPNPVAAVCADSIAVSATSVSTAHELHLAAIHVFCTAVDSAVRDALRAAADPGEPASSSRTPAPGWPASLRAQLAG